MRLNIRKIFLVSTIFLCFSDLGNAGEFEGELVLLPDGCESADARICRLGAPLTYRSSRDGLVWQTDVWSDSNAQSGTTDGASIPLWAQPVIGDAYDPSFLKAAIVHDHYCYQENHVRTWRQTHRMFYDALNDLGVDPIKAKIMYFAVYWRGPRWVTLVPGENCGENCIKNVAPGGRRWEGDQYTGAVFETELARLQAELESGLSFSVEDLEARAEMLSPESFFFEHGGTYTPTGADDPNILPRF